MLKIIITLSTRTVAGAFIFFNHIILTRYQLILASHKAEGLLLSAL